MHLRFLRFFAAVLGLTAWAGLAQAEPMTAALPTPSATGPQETGPKQEAARRFERAIKLYEDGDYALALAEFERVYELVPDYRVLYNIGQVSVQLGRYARALSTFREYLRQGAAELPAERVSEVQADLANLGGRTAQVDVRVDLAGAEIVLDGSLVGTAPSLESLVVDVGEHRIQVRAPGYVPQTADLSLAGGDHLERAFKLEPEQKPIVRTVVVERPVAAAGHKSNHNPFPRWVGWASVGTLAAGAVALEVLGANEAANLERQRTSLGASRAELDATRSRAKNYLVGADIAGGAALVAGSITLYFELWSSPASERQTPRIGSARLLLGPGRLALDGNF
jgi:PEGA domain